MWRHAGPAGVLPMVALLGHNREVSEVEPPELRLRNDLLFLITLGDPAKRNRVEVDIRIHNVGRSTFRFVGEFQVHGSDVS